MLYTVPPATLSQPAMMMPALSLPASESDPGSSGALVFVRVADLGRQRDRSAAGRTCSVTVASSWTDGGVFSCSILIVSGCKPAMSAREELRVVDDGVGDRLRVGGAARPTAVDVRALQKSARRDGDRDGPAG